MSASHLVGDPKVVVSPDASETQWQGVVVGVGKFYGWVVYHTYDSRRSHAGWPDLVLAGHGRVLFAELKARTGRLSRAQRMWLGLLRAAGLEVAVWRPADLDDVVAALGPRQQRLVWRSE
ncbi:MAG: VRR-NUC domain-containing protein [Frankiaceae bacterium]|jgi:hypothetical protein